MNTLPKISVVTVCRNAVEALRSTVDSVLAQSYSNVEYIIIDGASTDDTVSYLKQLSAAVKWVSEPDNGIYDAMNKGIAQATGQWVIFMNAGDCFADSDTLETIFSVEDYTDFGVVYGDVIKLDAEGNRVVHRAGEPRNHHRMFFCHQCVFVRREELLATPFETRYRMSADFCQMKMLYKRGVKFKHIDVPVAVFDTAGVSNVSRSRGLRDNIRVVNDKDSFSDKLRFLPHLLFPYIVCRLRGK